MAVHGDAVDALDGLMDELAEKEDRRPGRGEVVFPEELILARAGFVDFEVAGKAVGFFDGRPFMRRKTLGGQLILLRIRPLGEAFPDGGEVFPGRVVGGEGQHILRSGKRHVVLAHPVKIGYAAFGFKRRTVIERGQVAVNSLAGARLHRQGADRHHRKLQALGLMDGHHLHVTFRERLIRVLVFVDATRMKQAQETVEKTAGQRLPVAIGDNRVAVENLKGVEKLGEDGQVAGCVFIFGRASERL